MMRIRYIPILALSFLLLMSCDDLVDYYIGIPQQPELTEEPETNEFNIFGLLRPDSIARYNKSFVFVQRIWPALSFESFSIIPDAEVFIRQLSGPDSVLRIEFPLMPPDTLFFDSLYRPVQNFTPVPGLNYQIRCVHPDLNTAQGDLIFPSKPRILENTLRKDGSQVSFVLEADTLIAMYDIYLSGAGISDLVGRFVREGHTDIEVELELPTLREDMKLKIYSYEDRLATYIGNSNTALNFNKYREGFSSLDTGYGVFGALNFIEVNL